MGNCKGRQVRRTVSEFVKTVLEAFFVSRRIIWPRKARRRLACTRLLADPPNYAAEETLKQFLAVDFAYVIVDVENRRQHISAMALLMRTVRKILSGSEIPLNPC